MDNKDYKRQCAQAVPFGQIITTPEALAMYLQKRAREGEEHRKKMEFARLKRVFDQCITFVDEVAGQGKLSCDWERCKKEIASKLGKEITADEIVFLLAELQAWGFSWTAEGQLVFPTSRA